MADRNHNEEEKGAILPRRTLEAAHESSSTVVNPLDLSPRTVSSLQDLTDIEIDVMGAHHLIQRGKRCLIREGRIAPFTIIYVVLDGAVEWHSGGESWTVRPGRLIVCNAGQSHSAFSLEDRFEVISIHVHVRLAGAAPRHPLFSEMVHDLPGSIESWRESLDAVASLWEWDDRTFHDMTGETIRFLLFKLVLRGAALMPHPRATDPRVRQAMEIIGQQIGNPGVMQEVHRVTKVSNTHLRRLFQKDLNISPKAYHQDVRLHEVLRLLNRHDLLLKEIADRLGYSNQQHLEKDFKKKFGMAPGKFRDKR